MSLKNKAIQENILEKPPSWKFHKYYYEIVNKYGRMHDLELMLKLMPKTDFGKVRRSARLGLRMMRQGKVNEAIASFREAIRLKPDYAIAESNLGAALEQQGDLKEAAAHFGAAVRLDPNNGGARAGLERVRRAVAQPGSGNGKAR